MTPYRTEKTLTLGQQPNSAFFQLASSLRSRNGLIFLCYLLLLGMFAFLGARMKSQLTTSQVGSAREKGATRKQTMKELKELAAREHNARSLYIN